MVPMQRPGLDRTQCGRNISWLVRCYQGSHHQEAVAGLTDLAFATIGELRGALELG